MDEAVYEGIVESIDACLELPNDDFDRNLTLLVSQAMLDVAEYTGRNWCVSFANHEMLSWI